MPLFCYFTEFTVNLKFEQDVYYVDEGISSKFLALHVCVFVDTPVSFTLTLTPVSIIATGKTNKEKIVVVLRLLTLSAHAQQGLQQLSCVLSVCVCVCLLPLFQQTEQ